MTEVPAFHFESDDNGSKVTAELMCCIQAALKTGNAIRNSVNEGRSFHISTSVIFTSILARFPEIMEHMDVNGMFRRALDLQELVAIWLNEYTDLGISGEFERKRANGERFAGLLSLQNSLQKKVEAGKYKYLDLHNVENQEALPTLLDGFINDAVLLSQCRGDSQLPVQEYLDLDSAIHEVAFIGSVCPAILERARIPIKKQCESPGDLKNKYQAYLADSQNMHVLNSYEKRMLELHALSMLLKMNDDQLDAGSENTDLRLRVVSYSNLNKNEWNESHKRYIDILSGSKFLHALAPGIGWAFNATSRGKIHDPKIETPSQADVYLGGKIVDHTDYTHTLRHQLLFNGALEELFPIIDHV